MADYPSPEEIRAAAERIRDEAWRIKGEKELRYIPTSSGDHHLAGTKAPEEIGLGTVIPEGLYGPFATDENGYYLGTTEQWEELKSQYEWIPESFERRLQPYPAQFEDPIADVQLLATNFFNPGNGDELDGLTAGESAIDDPIQKASGYTNGWSGYFAPEFKDNFMTEFPRVARRQAAIAGCLYTSLVASRDVYVAARQTLGEIADKTEVALDAVLNGKESCPGGKYQATFGLIAAAATVVAGVAGLPVGGGVLIGAGAVAGWTIIAGVSSGISVAAGETSNDDPPPDYELYGHRVDDVILNMIEALGTRDTQLTDKENEIRDGLQNNMDIIEQNAVEVRGGKTKDNAFLPPRPGLLDATEDQIRDEGFYA